MAVKKYSEAYAKARDVFSTQQFEAGWQKFFVETCRVKGLLGATGLDASCNSGLNKIRDRVAAEVGKGVASGAVILKSAQSGVAGGSLQERAAAVKMLKHTYLVQHTEGQDVWVYSPPKDHVGWIFDEIVGSPEVIEPKLSSDVEIFSTTEREWMSSCLKIALKVCEDTRTKLSAKSDATAEIVKRWFIDPAAGDVETASAFEKLSEGFKKIAVVCGSKTLMFTDYPDWRAQRNKYFGGAMPGGEGGGFPVIYLEGAFTRLTGNTGKQWLCVETIIHEFSHHEVRTRDHRYDSSGLKPSAAFPYAKAIENADSWGYFALDLAGYLSAADREKTCK